MRFLVLFCLLCAFGGVLSAQTACPDVTRRGDTLFAPEAQTYQWLHDGAEVPGATQRFYVPPNKDGVFTVRLKSLTSMPLNFTPLPTVVVTGAVLDEFLRPINGAEVTVAGVKTNTDADGRFYIAAQRAERLAARATVAGFFPHTVGFMPTTGDTQFVYVHLAKQVTTHKLPANTGGTISQGGFWLTLPPKSVATEDGKPYSGEIQLSVVARRPGDRDFAQRMPGGDFMAVDASGASKVLYSYGFTGVEMTTADGKPLNMAPDSVATIEFLITEEQRPGAPAEMPLWHFDEDKGLWKESGTVRKEGLTYRADVPHFSWWNCDQSFPPAYIEGNVVDCKGNPILGGKIVVNQREAATDKEGRFNGTVPATIELDFTIVNTDTVLAPLAAEERRLVGTFNAGWGVFEAVGVADTNKLLTVYAYGATEGVEYSLDGEQWQNEPVFVLQNDSVPPQGMARVGGCFALSFNNYASVHIRNCQLLDAATLAAKPCIGTLNQLLGAKEAFYRVQFYDCHVIQAIAVAATLQPCVQSALFNGFNFYGFHNTPTEWVDGLNRLFNSWPNLQILNLHDNQLTSLPASLGNLTNLQTLELTDSQLATLPASLGNLTNLQTLKLTFNKLRSLPQSLGNLTNLQTLHIYNNQLANLPVSIGGLTNLQTLYVYNNQLTNLPVSLGNLTKLRMLYLNDNQLTSVPESIGNLTNLESLDLRNNQLMGLPESIGNLTDLQTLYLSYNQLTGLPESIGNLTNLPELNSSNNRLTSLPESVGNLTNLKSLNLHGNQLTALPTSFANLADTLQTLNLTNNPISPAEQARIRAMLPNTSITF